MSRRVDLSGLRRALRPGTWCRLEGDTADVPAGESEARRPPQFGQAADRPQGVTGGMDCAAQERAAVRARAQGLAGMAHPDDGGEWAAAGACARPGRTLDTRTAEGSTAPAVLSAEARAALAAWQSLQRRGVP
jgi:hypothetical protein